MNRNVPPMSRVYFLKPAGMRGPIKIGVSAHPMARLGTYSGWSPFPLELIIDIPGDAKLEKALHSHFAGAHSHREWFYPTAELLRVIDGLASGQDIGTLVTFSGAGRGVHALKLADAAARKGTSMETYVL